MKHFILILILILSSALITQAQSKKLYQITKNVNSKNIAYLVPFKGTNGKWGYLDCRTMQVTVVPSLDKARSVRYNSMDFYYNGIEFSITPPNKVEKMERFDAIQAHPPIERGSIDGFETEDGEVIYFSNKYDEIHIIKGYVSPRGEIAIVTDQNKLQGVIYNNGDVVSNFDLKYEKILYFINQDKKIIFVTKEPNNKLAIFFDFEHNKLDFPDVINFDNYIVDHYLLVNIEGGKKNVLDLNNAKFVLKDNYDKIMEFYVRKLKFNGEIIPKCFFFVKKGKNEFYIDERNIKYIPKNSVH